jgi:hypothetical protein
MSLADDLDYYDPSDYYERQISPKQARQENQWQIKDGSYILIADMTDKHLFNAYMMCGSEDLFEEMVIRLFERRLEPPKILFGGN